MQQFQSHGGMLCDSRYLSVVLRREQNEHGAHALAATLSDMRQRLREQSVVVGQSLVEKFDEIEQIMLNRVFDKIQIVHYKTNL